MPTFRDNLSVQAVQEERLSRNAGGSYQSTLLKIPEKRRSVSLKLKSLSGSLSDKDEQINVRQKLVEWYWYRNAEVTGEGLL